MGAQADRDSGGLQLQHAAYLQLHAQLAQDIEEIPVRARAASREMETLLQPMERRPSQVLLQQWAAAGIPDVTKATLAASGVPDDVVAAAEAGAKQPNISAQVTQWLVAPDPRGLEPFVAGLSDIFQQIGRTTAAEAEPMLAQARDASAFERP